MNDAVLIKSKDAISGNAIANPISNCRDVEMLLNGFC